MRWLALFLLGCSSPSQSEPSADSGATGFLLHYENALGVAPGAEGTHCLDVTSSPVDTWVSGWRVRKEGVHHVNLWRREKGTPWPVASPCSGGWGFGTFVLDSSRAELEERLPEGTAMLIPASTALIFDVHFLNASASPVPESVDVEFFPSEPATPVSGLLWLQSVAPLALKPGESRTVTYALPGRAAELVSLMGHQHAHGIGLTVTVDGAEAYRSTSWNDPPLTHPGLTIGPAARVEWSCSFQNDTAAVIEWGTKLQTAEMCQVYGLATGGSWDGQAP